MVIEITDPDKIWELRLALGDLGDITLGDDQHLSDEAYQFFINNATNDKDVYYKRKALMQAAMAILANISHGGARQRIGQEEIYGKELVDSWLAFLKLLQKPSYTGLGTPVVYFGGVYREAMEFYATNPEIVDPAFYRGQQDRSPAWKYKRQQTFNSVVEPEETKHFIHIQPTP